MHSYSSPSNFRGLSVNSRRRDGGWSKCPVGLVSLAKSDLKPEPRTSKVSFTVLRLPMKFVL